MPDTDTFRADLDGDFAQESIARAARGVLQRAALLFGKWPPHPPRRQSNGSLLLARKRLDPGRVLTSLGAT